MGHDLDKRLATELNRLATDEAASPQLERMDRMRRIAAELRRRLPDGDIAVEADNAVPGKRTQIEHLLADTVAKLAEVVRTPFAATPWSSRATSFDDYRIAALAEVL